MTGGPLAKEKLMRPTHAPTTAPSPPTDRRGVAARESDGVEISLLWSRSTDRVRVVVFDTRLDDALDFDVVGEDALAAFHHPYAYAAALGVPFGDTACASLDPQPQN